jgi:ACS family allantoate permease-like MFS transporter
MLFVLPSLAGVSIQYATRNTGALLFGYYILPGFVAGVGQAFAMPGANATGYTWVSVTQLDLFYVN